MGTVALTSSLARARQMPPAVQRPHPLLAVLTWELRRFRASRLFWFQALGFFGFLLLIMWYSQMPAQFGTATASGFIAGTSAWGLLMTLPIDALLLVLLLPFVTTDGVTRDLSRRTHELLMATPLPTWAYVWGRYLMGLVVSLGLALLLLAAILGMGWLLHLTVTDYPAPEMGTVLLLWGGMVVPATILISSLTFALGTVFPRQTTQIKITILVAWVGGAVILPDLVNRPAIHTSLPAWYANWDPTGRAAAFGTFPQYQTTYNTLSQTATNSAQLQQLLNTIENKVPDVSAWMAPHVIEAILGLLLVLGVTLIFHRFRAA